MGNNEAGVIGGAVVAVPVMAYVVWAFPRAIGGKDVSIDAFVNAITSTLIGIGWIALGVLVVFVVAIILTMLMGEGGRGRE